MENKIREITNIIREELVKAKIELKAKHDLSCLHEYRTKMYSNLTETVEIILWEIDKIGGLSKLTLKDLVLSTFNEYFPIKLMFGYGGYEDEKHPYWGKRLLYDIKEDDD